LTVQLSLENVEAAAFRSSGVSAREAAVAKALYAYLAKEATGEPSMDGLASTLRDGLVEAPAAAEPLGLGAVVVVNTLAKDLPALQQALRKLESGDVAAVRSLLTFLAEEQPAVYSAAILTSAAIGKSETGGSGSGKSSGSSLPMVAGIVAAAVVLLAVLLVLARRRRNGGGEAGTVVAKGRAAVAFSNPMYEDTGAARAHVQREEDIDTGIFEYDQVGGTTSSEGLYQEPDTMAGQDDGDDFDGDFEHDGG
jgi:hypothetical protein